MRDSSDAPPISGLLENKYELVGMIGRGGMGSVWEARHHTLGTRFAVKFIEAEYADSEEARKRFKNEAQAAATIQSKHAIQIYDHGITHDGKPFIVMELLVGEPLDKRIERLARLSLQDTARIIAQVSRGLARAHERGIVHRDLKPENIFLVKTPEDDDEIAKVLDFGIAKIQNHNNPAVTSSTKTGAVLGTPFYMSPEQARGLRNVDHRTDVWSLGVIAFKCVTGKLPFDGESVGDLLVKICTAPVPMPSQSVPGLPASFDAWFMRALEREPERRFQTVTELADGLSYAAGMTPRGAAPFSQAASSGQATVAASGQPQIVVTPPPGAMPAYATPRPSQEGPAPGAMTAAPFTSSTPVPGVPTPGRAKYVVLAALAGLLVAGGSTGGYLYVKKHQVAVSDNAVGITAPPPASISAPPPPSSVADNTKPPDQAPPPASAAPPTKDTSSKAGAGAAPSPGTKIGVGPAGGTTAKAGTGAGTAGKTTHTDTTPPATTTAHDSPTKKPPTPPGPKNPLDPGY
jgi:serine/threonine-protein kinase